MSVGILTVILQLLSSFSGRKTSLPFPVKKLQSNKTTALLFDLKTFLLIFSLLFVDFKDTF